MVGLFHVDLAAIFFFLSPLFAFFSVRSPGGCAGMHHTGLHTVSMWPLGCSGGSAVLLQVRWLWSQFATHTGIPPLLQTVPSDFTWLYLSCEIQITFFLPLCSFYTR